MVTDDDDDEKAECIINLRSEEEEEDDMTQFLEQEFDPQKIEDFDVIDVDACRESVLKNKLVEIQADEDLTDSDVKVVFVVVSEEDFLHESPLHGSCQDEFDKLQATLGDLNCDNLEEFEDFITIGIDSSSECKALKMKEAVLEENAELKE